MVNWITVNSHKISKIAYNAEIETMYIDFKGSKVDTPYTGVTKGMFKLFCNATDIDEFYDTHIKDSFKKIERDTKFSLNCRL